MFQSRGEYDRGVNTFSPEGRLFQVEYAIEAIKLGSTSIGIQTREGIVLAVEKRLTSSLIVPSSVDKLFEIDSHIGCAVSGLTADARMLVEHARVECQQHRFVFNEPMKCNSLTQAVCDLALKFGENGSDSSGGGNIMSRPFGVALLIGSVDEEGSHLFFADPSGTYLKYSAKAIGSGNEIAQNQLAEEYKDDLSLEDAQIMAAKILKQVMEDQMDSKNSQIATITKETGFKLFSESEITALMQKI